MDKLSRCLLRRFSDSDFEAMLEVYVFSFWRGIEKFCLLTVLSYLSYLFSFEGSRRQNVSAVGLWSLPPKGNDKNSRGLERDSSGLFYTKTISLSLVTK